MNRLIANIAFLFLLSVAQVGYGQISPGDLSSAHKDLEGMSSCTACHEIGDKVLNNKCLECHKEIQTLLNENKGYHAIKSVAKKDCFECHSEHHGRKFDMVRFDEANFNHDLTNYKLEGKHAVIDCRQCHVADNIQDLELKKRPQTFLGLSENCTSCHADFHQGTLSSDCKQCHTMNAFRPASKFDHSKTDFALNGGHADVSCVECHEKTTKNGVEFQKFAGVNFNDCNSCHDNPHNEQIQGKCFQCHTDKSFSIFEGQERFDHNTTGFTLNGKHQSVDCFNCHKENSNPKLVFQDKLHISENNCVKCHNDVHQGKFGLDCAKCHKETSFLTFKKMDFFDHTLTDYPLEGKHVAVDCKQCHHGRYSEALDYSACKNCHDDYHRGEFAENGISPDCKECHSLNEGFGYSLYTLEQHQESNFALEGAHYATPCFACHVSEKENRWSFKELGSHCMDCHQDIHKGYISQSYYPAEDCKKCHNNDSWSAISDFDHSSTGWPLNGKHLEIDCKACHFIEKSDNNGVATQKFANLDTNCASCHENIHEDAFAINGVTDCVRCHVTSSWMPENFDHNTTNFPLTGKHRLVECRACHSSEIVNGKTVVKYKINKFECIDCHL